MPNGSVNKKNNQIPSVTYTAMTQNREMVNFKDYLLFLGTLSGDVNDLYFKSTRVTPYLTKISGPTVYPVQLSDFFIQCDATNGPITINLPQAGNKRMLIIKRIDSTNNVVTLQRYGSDTIETIFPTIKIFSSGMVSMVSDSFSNWMIFSAKNTSDSFSSSSSLATNVKTYQTYSAFGDSITFGQGASPSTDGYAWLVGIDLGSQINNQGTPSAMVSDVANLQVFPNANYPSRDSTISTLMIGTNDSRIAGIGTYESVFNLMQQAVISWLAIGSEYKVFGQSGSNTQTGTWANDNTYQTGIGLKSTTNASTLSIPISTTGGPIYLWYRIINGNGGVFTWKLNGGPTTSVNCFTSPTIQNGNGSTQAVGVFRILNVPSGNNTILITVTSATGAGNIVSILGVGTVPPVYANPPMVFVGGVIHEQNGTNDSITAAYNSDVQNNVNLLAGDGLFVSFVDTRDAINSTSDMFDSLHPNNTGHQKLRNVFEQSMNTSPSASGQPTFIGPWTINQTAPASTLNYCLLNGNNLANNTALNPGILFFGSNGNQFGIDLGFSSGQFSTRLFTGSIQNIAFSKVNTGSAPTAQSNFTDLVLIDTNAHITVYGASPSNTSSGYLRLNGNNNASTTNLNAGITVYDGNNQDAFGMDLGYNSGTGRFRTRLFTNPSKDISFSSNTSGGNPSAQSNFTDLVVIRGDTGNMGIGTENPLALIHNNGSTCFTVLQLGNFATGGSIGSAATTVDIYTSIEIAQTNAGQTLTLPNPTNTGATRLLYIINTGSNSFTMLGKTINTSAALTALWSHGLTAWVAAGNG